MQLRQSILLLSQNVISESKDSKIVVVSIYLFIENPGTSGIFSVPS